MPVVVLLRHGALVGEEVEITLLEHDRACMDIRHDAGLLDGDLAREQILADGDLHLSAVSQAVKLLDGALAEGSRADDNGTVVLLEGAGDDLGTGSGSLICQDNHGILGLVAGISYQLQENNVVEIQGTVVNSPLKERGIGTAIIEDFCSRMASQDIHVIKAHFSLQPFYEKLGFHVDKSWGALVKFIVPETAIETPIEDDIKSTID